jgi:predicted PurR-regulated permease PerM
MALSRKESAWHPFFWLATLVLVVAVLALARTVLVPLALAVLIAFALTPAVRPLERRLGRGLAVTVVVLLAIGAVVSFGYLLERQLVSLTGQVSRYSESMRRKVATLRPSAQGGLATFSRTVDTLVQELDQGKQVPEARPVRVVPGRASATERIANTVGPVLRPLADFVVVFVLVIFLVGRRNDLRDRFIRLAGRRHISLTTRTLDEAGQRISRFLLVQSAINGTFGLAVAIGLSVIGVGYAPLCGFLAAALRFVPFLGTLLGMLLPTTLAFAQLDGWWPMFATMALFLALDATMSYAVEPLVIGRRTGVSSLAMIVMALFWTWLWGPVGLLLSTPLTVCLAVLGRQVSRLGFLAVLLGDESPLEPEVTFYQRLLAGDEDDAARILDRSLAVRPREQAFDALMVPALHLLRRDRAEGAISEADHEGVLAAMGTLLADLPGPRPTPAPTCRRALAVPGQGAADAVAWQMLALTLDMSKVQIDVMGVGALVSEVVEAAARMAPDLVCIVSVAPGGGSHVRHLCRRLHQAQPGLRIVVMRLEPEGEAPAEDDPPAGNIVTASSLSAARLRIEQACLLEAPADRPLAVSLGPAASVS